VPTPIFGTDLYNAVEVAPLESAADDPGYPTQWFRVPHAGETTKLERDSIPQSPEITSLGALRVLDYGTGHWRGTIRTLIYYNARFMHLFLCHLCGGLEGLEINRMLNGGTPVGLLTNTHFYIPQSFKSNAVGSASAIPWGLAIRIYKMGPDNTAGSAHKILRAFITEATFEFPETGWPTALWTIEGPEPTLLSTSGITPIVADPLDYPVKPDDFGKAPAHPVLPSLSRAVAVIGGTRNLSSFSINVKNNLRYPRRSLTAYDTDYNIGHIDNFEVTARFEALLEQNELGVPGGGVYQGGIAPNVIPPGERRFRAISAPSGAAHSQQTPMIDVTNNIPYGFEISTPAAGFVEMQAPIDRGGALLMRWSERWFQGTIPATLWPPSAAWKAPVIIAAQVLQTDEPANDTKFASTVEGGNVPHSTLAG